MKGVAQRKTERSEPVLILRPNVSVASGDKASEAPSVSRPPLGSMSPSSIELVDVVLGVYHPAMEQASI